MFPVFVFNFLLCCESPQKHYKCLTIDDDNWDITPDGLRVHWWWINNTVCAINSHCCAKDGCSGGAWEPCNRHLLKSFFFQHYFLRFYGKTDGADRVELWKSVVEVKSSLNMCMQSHRFTKKNYTYAQLCKCKGFQEMDILLIKYICYQSSVAEGSIFIYRKIKVVTQTT